MSSSYDFYYDNNDTYDNDIYIIMIKIFMTILIIAINILSFLLSSSSNIVAHRMALFSSCVPGFSSRHF